MSQSSRKRVLPAPAPSNPRLRSMVLDVECDEDEDVVWHWTNTVEGRFVSGYSIINRRLYRRVQELEKPPRCDQEALLRTKEI